MTATFPPESEPRLFSPQEMGDISLEDVFEAYFDCRKRKRNSRPAMDFELDYERECIDLWRDINAGTYRHGRSIAFIVDKPVKREIFAASFRDRVVHHLIARRIEPLLEQQFITDSYSTRKGKGTLYGIHRVEGFIRECSENYTRDCYILKIDIRSFFMSIPKQPLYDKIECFLHEHYTGRDLPLLLAMLRETIFNRPEKNCVRRSPRPAWRKLPPDKSLFHTDGSHGLPIGNLTSQLLALYYLDELDHKVQEEWGIRYYGRYVDDMVLVHPSKQHLLQVRHRIGEWLAAHGLRLHPRKLYLQHYSKGVSFVGGILLPGRLYVGKRVAGNAFRALDVLNEQATARPQRTHAEATRFVSVFNSYYGMMKHFSTYHIRKRLMSRIAPVWWKYIYLTGHLDKAVLKHKCVFVKPANPSCQPLWPLYQPPLPLFQSPQPFL